MRESIKCRGVRRVRLIVIAKGMTCNNLSFRPRKKKKRGGTYDFEG